MIFQKWHDIEKNADLNLAKRISREAPLIFWGYSDITEQIISLLVSLHNNIKVWDTEKNGQRTKAGNILIEPFSLEDMPDNELDSAIFILTFDIPCGGSQKPDSPSHRALWRTCRK